MAVKNLGVINRYEIRDGRTVSKTAVPTEKNKIMNKTIWFEIGRTIKNGAGEDIPMTVAARTQLEYEDCLAKGWKPAEIEASPLAIDSVNGPAAPIPDVTKRKRKK